MSHKFSIPPEGEGCWFDSARGIYIGKAVIELAVSYGFVVSPEDEEYTTPDGEFYNEVWGEAESYMQNFAPAGYYFGSTENGDWGLWRIEDEN